MANSILELAVEAASSTLFIFCFFNLIVLILLFTSKPVSFSSFDHPNDDDDDDDMPLSIVVHSNTNTTEQNFMLQKDPTVDVCEVTEIQNEPERCMNFTFNDNVEQSDDDHEDDDEDEDEFRRKVEEFIEKVNRGWREERQRTSRPSRPVEFE